MARSYFFVVTDDQEMAAKGKYFAHTTGSEVKVISVADWNRQVRGSNLQVGENASVQEIPSLSAGESQVVTPAKEEAGATVLHFPVPTHEETTQGVETINNLESKAIENAINVYKGNLTEAAKALGIGRATLYRKVKQYNINPQEARRKRAA